MQGRRERSYLEGTGATEDAAARMHSAATRHRCYFAEPSYASRTAAPVPYGEATRTYAPSGTAIVRVK